LIGVDHVDILFLHEPQLVNARDISRILELMQSFVEQGTVGRLGLGGNLTSAFKPYMGKGKFEVVSGFLRMNACNLEAFPADVEFLKKNSVAYYNASILHFALLGERLSRYKVNFEKEKSWLKKSDLNRAERLLDVSKKYQLPMSSLAFRYAIGIKEADRIVMGAKNKAQLLQSLKDWEEGPLPLNLFEEITDLAISKSEVEIDRVLK